MMAKKNNVIFFDKCLVLFSTTIKTKDRESESQNWLVYV